MNSVVNEMRAILEGDENVLAHIGVKRRSGRYPWGSGEEPYQHGMDFLARYDKLKKLGYDDKRIAKELNMLNEKGEPSTTILRLEKKYCNDMRKIDQMETAKRLRDKEGLGPSEIARRMGLPNESSARSLLNPASEERARLASKTADFLREQVDQKKMIDISKGTERELSFEQSMKISKERLQEAVYILEKEGYKVYSGGIAQPTNPGQQTTQKVLCAPGTKHNEIYQYDKVQTIYDYVSKDGGSTFTKLQYPKSLDSKRLKVLLADEIGPDGERGVDKDGIIQIRRGVDDLSLGTDRYAQVRILVDDNKYLKGMAVYSDNMPDGVDVIFNSNKKSYEKALKDIKTDDPMNPFGANISPNGQSTYIDKNGKEQLSLINKTRSEGDWSDWTDTLPSQFLSKQSLSLAKKQLGIAKADKLEEYELLRSLENPTVKKHLLQKFADECDSAAVNLKAAAIPGQKYHVMIPVNTLKDNEVYAPRYENGTKLALVRYPHAGTFEIPIVTVNNKHAKAKELIGTDSYDAIGLNKKNADRLSGADFDGDTVMCLPTHNGKIKITSTDPLPGLVGFDPQMAYPERPGMKYMKDPVTGKDSTQKEMGVISNLISDMTLFGAPPEDMAKAVRHSMVVIDAGKHKLDYKRSEVENDIARLKKDWQVHIKPDGTVKYGGAATIVSRAKGEETIDKRQGTPKVNIKGKDWYDPSRPEGALIYKTADDLHYAERIKYDKTTGDVTYRTNDGKKLTYNVKNPDDVAKYAPTEKKTYDDGTVVFTNKAGDIEYRSKTRTQASTRMAETDDAYDLVSNKKHPHPMEVQYADYANYMKSLANQARKDMMTTKEIPYSKEARTKYQDEYNSLTNKLNTALLNAGRERAALRKANAEIEAQKLLNPNMEKGDLKKLRQRAVSTARDDVGAIKRRDRNIEITDREWEAIQNGAVTKTQLNAILNNTDISIIREKATPVATRTLSTAKVSKLKVMRASGSSLAEIASALGVSTSTVSKYLKNEKEEN